MAKCFFTGIEQPVEEMFILDITAARKAVRTLRHQIAAVEHIIEQLNAKDEAEVYSPATKISRTLRLFRLVTPIVAQALSVACPDAGLFMPWNAFKARRREHFAMRNVTTVQVSHADSSGDGADNKGGAS